MWSVGGDQDQVHDESSTMPGPGPGWNFSELKEALMAWDGLNEELQQDLMGFLDEYKKPSSSTNIRKSDAWNNKLGKNKSSSSSSSSSSSASWSWSDEGDEVLHNDEDNQEEDNLLDGNIHNMSLISGHTNHTTNTHNNNFNMLNNNHHSKSP